MSIDKITFRKATGHDISFMYRILVEAAVSSGVEMTLSDLPAHPDTYQYVEGFPTGLDIGVIAETIEVEPVGAAWIRMLPTDAHAVGHLLPELTMGIVSGYRRMGIGERLLEELYKAASEINIPKISLGVHKDNLPAINLYKKQGWREVGSFKDYIMMSRKTEKPK